MTHVTIAPITSRAKGVPTEVPVGLANGLANGLEIASVISCDKVQTIPASTIGRQAGWLLADQEAALTRAIGYAFDFYGGFGSDPWGWA
jgi:mRNA interferase MazF